MNIGIRLRQRRGGAWTWPLDLAGARTVGFGLCSGTSAPYGSAVPTHFIGVRTGANWARVEDSNWWDAGWVAITRAGGTETQHGTGDCTLRVGLALEASASAWYMRLTKTSATTMRMTLFLPTGQSTPSRAAWKKQLGNSVWQQSVDGHQDYRETVLNFASNEAGLGTLTALNVFSNLANIVTSQLRGIEVLDLKGVRIA